MTILLAVACICGWVITLGLRSLLAELSETFNSCGEVNSERHVRSNWNALSYPLRFVCALGACIGISIVIAVYSVGWVKFGIWSLKILWPLEECIGFMILVLPTSLVGAFIFVPPFVKKSVFYQKVVWWLFPSGVAYWFLSYPFGGYEDSGMGSILLYLGFIPVFAVTLGLTYAIVNGIYQLVSEQWVRTHRK